MSLDSDTVVTIADIEAPRFLSCSFIPYGLNEESDVVILMRNKKCSKNPDYYVDFGTSYKEGDPNILYSAAKSYVKKCGGLLLANQIQYLDNPEEVSRILKETVQKNSIELFENAKIKQILRTFVKNKSHVIYDVICEEHLAIFYPLPYFELEAINNVLSTASETLPNAGKYEDLTFHWITMNQIADEAFGPKFLTAFDYQVIAQNARKMTVNLMGDLKT